MPWGELEALVIPCYYEGKRENKPYELELMLQIHLLQYQQTMMAIHMIKYDIMAHIL